MRAPNKLPMDLRFGVSGRAESAQRGRWAEAEDEFTWALTPGCMLLLAMQEVADDTIALLDVWPQTLAPERLTRTMGVCRNGRPISELTVAQRGTYLVALGSTCSGTMMSLEFTFDREVENTDDSRPLAFAFRSLRLIARDRGEWTGRHNLPALVLALLDAAAARQAAAALLSFPLAEFLSRFESLGHSCDFGMFQRDCGAEPLGLLRFGALSAYGLVDGLIESFRRLGEPGSIEALVVEDWDNEYFMWDRSYGMTWHTFCRRGEISAESLISREKRRLPLLRNKFLQDLEQATKMFVLRPPGSMRLDEVEAVAAALRLHSDCKLLWVVQDGGVPGAVERVTPYLLRGYLDFSDRRGGSSMSAWLSVCLNAATMSFTDMRSEMPSQTKV